MWLIARIPADYKFVKSVINDFVRLLLPYLSLHVANYHDL